MNTADLNIEIAQFNVFITLEYYYEPGIRSLDPMEPDDAPYVDLGGFTIDYVTVLHPRGKADEVLPSRLVDDFGRWLRAKIQDHIENNVDDISELLIESEELY